MSMSMSGTIHMAVSILAILSVFPIHMSMPMTVSVSISILPIFAILSILWRYKFLKRAHRMLLFNLFLHNQTRSCFKIGKYLNDKAQDVDAQNNIMMHDFPR